MSNVSQPDFVSKKSWRKFQCQLLMLLASLFMNLEVAWAEVSVSFYGGLSSTPSSDVTIRQTGGTDIRLKDVSWRSESLHRPIYCGARVLFWLPRLREAGFGLDYSHAKVYANNSQRVEVFGTRFGRVVNGSELVGETITDLGFSHGLNFFMLVMHRRWLSSSALEPYIGVGMGISVPHVEGRIGKSNGNSYHYGGLAYQVAGGLSQKMLQSFSTFAEVKIQRTSMDVPYDQDTQLSTSLWVHQFAIGLTLAF